MDPTVRLIEDLADRALGRTDRNPVILPPPSDGNVHRHLAALDQNARVDEMPRPAGRGGSLKRLVLKLSGFFLVRQRAANLATHGALGELMVAIEDLRATLADDRRRTAAAIAAIEPRLTAAAQQYRAPHEQLVDRLLEVQREQRQLDEALHARGADISAVSTALDDLSRRVSDLRADALLEQTRRRALERRVLTTAPVVTGGPAAGADRSDSAADDEIPGFDLVELYERFEASFRPSDENLVDRFASYLPDLEPLAHGSLPVVDLGAGRGELLEVLAAAGIPCRGVDLNEEAIEIARSKGLDVVLADVVEHLAGLADESVGAVVALHLVEHLPPATLLALVDEIIRVLAPGGVIILETPNPTNLVVGASSFYHDPTHQRPVTPDYLSFLLHDRGFTNVEVRFLHPLPEYALEIPSLADSGMRGLEMLLTDLRWALKGPQDYAAVGRRPAGR